MSTHQHSTVITGHGPTLGDSLSHTLADQRLHHYWSSSSFSYISPPVDTLKSERNSVVPLSVGVTNDDQVGAAFAHIARELPPLRIAASANCPPKPNRLGAGFRRTPGFGEILDVSLP